MKYIVQYSGDKGYLRLSVKDFITDFHNKIDIDADYQRENVWTVKQKQDLLDSILQGIDIPKMYLAGTSAKAQFEFECVDGKQRMLAIINYFKPDSKNKEQLKVVLNGKLYSYQELVDEHPKFAKSMEDYPLDFVIYDKEFLQKHDRDFINLIFRRLQLGKPLNSGEILHAHPGPVRELIFNQLAKKSKFMKNTSLSEKRFSAEFTLAQISFNSINRIQKGHFERARLVELEDFFDEPPGDLDDHGKRIMGVLQEMDSGFKNEAKNISSRAVAVSAYMFVETLYLASKTDLVTKFAKFYLKLLEKIRQNSKTLNKYDTIPNRLIMENFHKYISQASVEESSIRKRDEFLSKAFDHYLKTEEIIGEDTEN